MAQIEVEKILALVLDLLEVPSSKIWVMHDIRCGLPYIINFKKPSHAMSLNLPKTMS